MVPPAVLAAAAILSAAVAAVLNAVAIPDLPHVLAFLNGLTVVLLTGGYVNIRRGRRQAHRAFMLGAVAVAAAFLVVYLYYHANAGLARFGGKLNPELVRQIRSWQSHPQLGPALLFHHLNRPRPRRGGHCGHGSVDPGPGLARAVRRA